MDVDEQFMARAIELAGSGPRTSPNPRVAAVAVRAGSIVAEAVHVGPGRPHAEAMLAATADLAGTDVFVTLEPCNHTGRTPPCVETLVREGVRRVVAPFEDPDERVSGRGFAELRRRGIGVTVGILAADAARLNRGYLHQRRTGRSLVTLKLATSIDGRLAAPDRSARWITSEATRRLVHERRRAVDAVVVGAGTVVADDPSLTVRLPGAEPSDPARVVVDSSGRTPETSRVFAPGAAVVVVTTEDAPHEAQTRWKEAGAEVVVVPRAPGGGVDLAVARDDWTRRGWLEVMCEGGGRLATSLVRDGIADRMEVHIGPVVVGDPAASPSPGIGDVGVRSLVDATRWKLESVDRMEDDVVASYVRSA